MKRNPLLILILLTIFLTSCGLLPETKQMTAVPYHQPVNLHISKNATLSWEVDKNYTSNLPSTSTNPKKPEPDLLDKAIDTVLENKFGIEQTESKPYESVDLPIVTSTYDKADQSVFMTSLYDVLNKNHVFKNIKLVAGIQGDNAGDVAITVLFKTPTVLNKKPGEQIVVSVDLIIKSQNRPLFRRSYTVDSHIKYFGSEAYLNEQIAISQRLLTKIITGIREWYQH